MAADALGGDQALTFQEALVLTGEHNRQLIAARAGIVQARAGVQQVWATYWPSLDLTTGVNQALSSTGVLTSRASKALNLPVSFPGTSALDSPTSQLTAGLNLGYDLDTHGARQARLQSAEAQQSLAELATLELSQQLRQATANAYFDLQAADNQASIAQGAVDEGQKLLADAKALQLGGEGTVFEVQRARMQLARARQGLIQAKANQVVARKALARTIGLPSNSQLSAADPIRQSPAWPDDLPQSLQKAIDGAPAKRRFDLQSALARLQHRLAWAPRGLRTQLSLAGDAPGILQPGGGSLPSMAIGTSGLGIGYTVGATVSWTLFDGGLAQAGADQADAGLEQASGRWQDTQLEVRLSVERAFTNLTASQEAVTVATEGEDAARQALESARLRLRAGVGTQTDVILSINDLVDARSRRLQAILDCNRARVDLERACWQLPLPLRVERNHQ